MTKTIKNFLSILAMTDIWYKWSPLHIIEKKTKAIEAIKIFDTFRLK